MEYGLNIELMKAKRRIDEEWVFFDALVHNLKHSGRHSRIEVDKETDDPPDFWLAVDGQRFAVEVTSIVADAGYEAICKGFADAVRSVVAERGTFAGTYAIAVYQHPKLPQRTSRQWNELLDKAALFVLSTGVDKSLLHRDSQGKIEVERLSLSGAIVGLIRIPGGKWAVEAEEEMTRLMQVGINKKLQRLQQKAIDGSHTILIFYDAYGFADIESARNALGAVSGYEWFHSVFWAASFADRPNELSPKDPGRLGFFLYSTNVTWTKSGKAE